MYVYSGDILCGHRFAFLLGLLIVKLVSNYWRNSQAAFQAKAVSHTQHSVGWVSVSHILPNADDCF